MKSLRTWIGNLTHNDLVWWFLSPLVKISSFLKAERNKKLDAEYVRQYYDTWNNVFGEIIRDRRVLHGPFKGLIYPDLSASGSALYPKLIGSYEHELHHILERICLTRYDAIYNIGCGEGYYAVGLARRVGAARVFAYDLDSEARQRTLKMAQLNNVDHRFVIGDLFCADDVKLIPTNKKCLIVCDCEGFEKSLFTVDNVSVLRDMDLLIEIHDFIDITISDYIKTLFGRSHHIEVVQSLDDIQKAHRYEFPEAKQFDLAQRKVLFGEGRPSIMEWFFLTPKAG